MAIVLLKCFRIVSAGRDSMSAGRDLPFQFNKSQNLSFSIFFGFKMMTFDKFIVYLRFLSFSIGFLSNFYHLLSNFYQILLNSIVLGRYDMLEEFYSSPTRSCYRNLQYRIVWTGVRPEKGIIAYPYITVLNICSV